MELIVVPPEFALLFIMPVLGFASMLYNDKDLLASVFVYLFLQIGLCALARYIYG
jgi:hypothetical protein|tara:strand:- start:2079 stop:2243 length:165 start_codon:yes stop_codon:yes gene_type:complete